MVAHELIGVDELRAECVEESRLQISSSSKAEQESTAC